MSVFLRIEHTYKSLNSWFKTTLHHHGSHQADTVVQLSLMKLMRDKTLQIHKWLVSVINRLKSLSTAQNNHSMAKGLVSANNKVYCAEDPWVKESALHVSTYTTHLLGKPLLFTTVIATGLYQISNSYTVNVHNHTCAFALVKQSVITLISIIDCT